MSMRLLVLLAYAIEIVIFIIEILLFSYGALNVYILVIVILFLKSC